MLEKRALEFALGEVWESAIESRLILTLTLKIIEVIPDPMRSDKERSSL